MWDDEIDAAARAVTGGRVARDLRSRVLARIEAGHGRPRWRLIGLPSAIGAVVVVMLLALFVNMHDGKDPSPRGGAASHTEAAADQQSAATVRDPTSGEPADGHAEATEPTRIAQVRSNPRTAQ